VAISRKEMKLQCLINSSSTYFGNQIVLTI